MNSKKERNYIVKHNVIDIESFIDKYVDIDLGIERCSNCRNFGKFYSCPEFDFDVLSYWRQFKYLHVVGFIINLDDDEKNHQFSEEEFFDGVDSFYTEEKRKVDNIQYKILEDNENVVGLGGGKCKLCEVCMREKNLPCIYPDKLLRSIESLGGKVSEITQDLLGIEILWCKDRRLPLYLTTVTGFLSDSDKIDLSFLEKYMLKENNI